MTMTWCDFWIYLFISIAGAFLGILGAYRIYRSQLKKDKEKENKAKESQERELLKYFHTLLTQIVATVNVRKGLFYDYIEKQKKNYAELTPMQSVSNNDFARAKNLDDSALFNAWMNRVNMQDKLKEYLTLQAELDYIEGAIINMDSIYDENSRKGFTVLTDVNKTLQKFIFALNKYLEQRRSESGKSASQSADTNFLNKLLIDHLQNSFDNKETPEKYTLNDVKNSLIAPIINHININMLDYPEELSLLIGEMTNGLREVEMQTKHVLQQFEITWTEIDKHLTATNNIIKHLESFKS